MPGWYIHMETAKNLAVRLKNGNVPPSFPGGAANAQALGAIAEKWRNYLAAGAVGPDLFFFLPDFKGETGNVLLTFVTWYRDVFEVFDSEFMSKWEKWAQPAIDGVGDVLNQMSGGVIQEISQTLADLSDALRDAFLDLLANLWDWFGLLTSGVPSGYANSAFYWSDMFHYRNTYAFASQLFKNATNDQQKAFAIGWMSHCATDVTGHSFVNEKAGGPWRDHWQRHHLVENHMDGHVYDTQHGGVEPYGELDTAALHFRLAFRQRNDAPYNGAQDAPAYDYIAGLPPYATGQDSASNAQRSSFWDLDTGDLPDDLCNTILKTMQDVFGSNEPRVIANEPQFADPNDPLKGRPNVETLQNTFWTVYEYLKSSTTGGYSPPEPVAPSVLNDHSPPTPPGSDSGVSDDPTRGDDPSGSDSFNLLDLILALFSWIAYIGEFAVWLATLPAAVVTDLLTYPARQVLFEIFVVPAWSLYMAARNPLVMSGFLLPKHEEINTGLAELGISPTGPLTGLAAALASPDGTGTAPLPFDEPSGRPSPMDAYGADTAYPRAIVEDTPTLIGSIVLAADPNNFFGLPTQPSEFLRPWEYPAKNNAGQTNGWEPGLTHPGPWLQGQDANILMNNAPGDDTARHEYENATTPAQTESISDTFLPQGKHLGDPVDYGVYVVGALTQGTKLPDFNLDSDRGYGYHCWDWNRSNVVVTPNISTNPSLPNTVYNVNVPCTLPEEYFDSTVSVHYDPNVDLMIHYLELDDPGCGGEQKVTPGQVKQAGITPTGGKADQPNPPPPAGQPAGPKPMQPVGPAGGTTARPRAGKLVK